MTRQRRQRGNNQQQQPPQQQPPQQPPPQQQHAAPEPTNPPIQPPQPTQPPAEEAGFDLDRFIKPPGEDMVCPICFSVPKNPRQTPCEHLLCAHCIHQWSESQRQRGLQNKCPVCNAELPPRSEELGEPGRLIKNMLGDLQLRCSFAKNGCSEIATLEKIDLHEAKCKFAHMQCSQPREVDCIVRGCEFRGEDGKALVWGQHMIDDGFLHMAIVMKELSKLQDERQELQSGLQKAQSALQNIAVDNTSLKSTLQRVEKQSADLKSKLQNSMDKLEARLKHVETENSTLKSTLRCLEKQSAELKSKHQSSIEDLRSTMQNMAACDDAQMKFAMTSHSELNARLKVVESSKDELQSKLRLIETENTSLKSTLQRVEKQSAERSPKLQDFKPSNDKLEARLKHVETENTTLKLTLQRVETRNTELDSNMQDFKASNNKLEARLQHVETENTSLKSTLQRVVCDNESLRQSIAHEFGVAHNEINSTKEHVRSLEHVVSEEHDELKARMDNLESLSKETTCQLEYVLTRLTTTLAESADFVVHDVPTKWESGTNECSEKLSVAHKNPALRYPFKLQVVTTTSHTTNSKYLGVRFIPQRGEEWQQLQWPISNRIRVSVLNTKGGSHKSFVLGEEMTQLIPPQPDNTIGWGDDKLLDQGDIDSGEFVDNAGRMFFKVEMLPVTISFGEKLQTFWRQCNQHLRSRSALTLGLGTLSILLSLNPTLNGFRSPSPLITSRSSTGKRTKHVS